jgi:hypothetical protein
VPHDLAALPDGGVVLTGYIGYGNQNDLDPGSDTVVPVVNFLGDIFLIALEDNGDFRWGRTYGSGGYDMGTGLAVVGSGSPVMIGNFYEPIHLDAEYLGGEWGQTAFVAKFSAGGPVARPEAQHPEIRVFPNPALAQLSITLPAGARVQEYGLYSLHGQLLAQGELRGGTQTIDVSMFSPGMYVLDAGKGIRLLWQKW